MIFGFLLRKKVVVPVEAGEFAELQLPSEKSPRRLYARVFKISKKRNIFVNFVSKDKGEDLGVGAEGVLTAINRETLVRFATRLLHRDGDVFIFSPPETFVSRKVSLEMQEMKLTLNLPIEYRAMASLHLQKGMLTEIASDTITFLVNLPIPATTLLTFDVPLPWKDSPAKMRGKVVSCEKSVADPKKFLVRASLDQLSAQDREALLWFSHISAEGDAFTS